MKRIIYTLLGMMLSVGAWAQTLQEQINSATEATTIQLSGNVDLGATLVIPVDKNITIDLNGYSITSTVSGAVAVKNNGTLTVKDTSGEQAGKIISTKYAGIGAGDNSVTTFESGNIESVEGAIITGKVVGATITIKGGTLSASDNAVIMGNGSARDGNANTITINGGTFNGQIMSSGYVACGIYAPWKDVITVNGGTFNITNGCGVLARAGSVTINGGEFNCSGTATGKVGDSRVVVPCSAVVYDSEAGYPAMTSESKIEVPSASTAKFTAAEGVAAVSVVKNDGADSHIEISGGTYSSPLTEDVCAEGYIPSDTPNADGTYGPVVGSYVAQIGDNKYASLTDALAAATAGQTVTLLADINEAVDYTNVNNVTIALNGKIWTSDSYTLKNNGGTITLEGDGFVKSTGDEGIAVWARTGSIIINGGNYENCSNKESTIYVGTTDANLAGKQPTITINGGSFKNTASGVYAWNTNLLPLTLNIINNIAEANSYQAIVINGGTFYGNDPSIGDDSQLNKINNNSNFISPELHAEMKDGVFVIEEGGYVAQVGYLKYTTLTEAVANAADATITLLADAEIETIDLLIGKTVERKSNGVSHKITVNSFTVVDGQPCNIPYNCIAKIATYTREVGENVWGTVCLPYQLDPSDDYTLYTVTSIEGSTMTVTEADYSLTLPGAPYIFYKKASGNSITFETENAWVYNEDDNIINDELVGTFTNKKIESGLESIYFINGDRFHQAKASLTVPAYRAYIKYSTSGARPSVLNMNIVGNDNMVDGIGAVTIDDMNSAKGIYDINGRQLPAPQKGVNIMKLANGKTVKLIVK